MAVGGNTEAILQIRSPGKKNAIGEREMGWVEYKSMTGSLDLSGGDSKWVTYAAKIQESTHIFLCDYQELGITAEECRMLVNGKVYDVLLIDDPMDMHEHFEIYLKYVGGQNVS